MSNETASWALKLDDGISAPAESAADALAKLDARIKRETKALAEMKRAQKQLSSGSVTNIAAFRELTAKMEASKNKIAEMRAQHVELGGTFGAVARRAKPTASSFEKLSQAAGMVPGPLGGVAAKLGNLKALGPLAMAAGIAAVASAILALGIAAGVAGVKLASYGIEQSDAARSELLRLEALTRIRRRFGGELGGNAGEMQQAMDRVSDATDLSRAKLEEYATFLHRRGLRGENFTQALEGMAIQGSVLGENHARMFGNMAAGAARAGTSVRRLADDVRTRLGDLAQRKMLALDAQTRRLRENLDKMFGGLRVEGPLKLFKAFADTFSQTTSRGRALKAMLERMFGPLFDAIGDGESLMTSFMEGIVIGLLDLEYFLLKAARAFVQTFGVPTLGRIDKARVALGLGAAVVGSLAAAFLVLGAVVVAPFALLAGAAYLGYKMGEGFVWLVDKVRAIPAALAELVSGWMDLGKDLVAGFVRGITSRIGDVVAGVSQIGMTAVNTLRSILDIRSPSRVFAGLGVQIPAGLAVGVEEGAGAVDAAVDAMTPTDIDFGAAAGAVTNNGGAQIHISMGGQHIDARGADDPDAVGASTYEAMSRVFEDLAKQLMAVPA